MSHNISLTRGHQMPSVGFGTWNIDASQATKAVTDALNAGYRHIDCAAIYGNEAAVGAAFEQAFASGKVSRSELFVTSKLWNTCHEVQHVRPALMKTLADLKLDYLDLYLIHWPMAYEFTGYDLDNSIPLDSNGKPLRAKVTILETWREMEKLVDEGLVKSIGVSNFPVMLLWDLLAGARIPPAVNQIECNPKHACTQLVKFCQDNNIHVTAYSPFGSTFAPLLEIDEIKALASKYNKPEANIVIRWAIQRGLSVLVKSWREDRIRSNLEKSLDFVLSDEDMDKINILDANQRSLDFSEDWGVNVWA